MQSITPLIIADLDKANLLNKVSRIILFGSRARGDENPRSDIDLAFDAPTLTESEWLSILDTLDKCATLLKIDAIHYNEAAEDLRQRINQEGVVVYERNKKSAKSD
jgi:predicted nucleotidyltransferase